MFVCVNCCTEMRCSKTGCDVIFNELVVYRGDEFECPKCGHKVRHCSEEKAPLFKRTHFDLPIIVWEY